MLLQVTTQGVKDNIDIRLLQVRDWVKEDEPPTTLLSFHVSTFASNHRVFSLCTTYNDMAH